MNCCLLKSVEMPEHNRRACLSKMRQDVIKIITDWIADESSDQKRVLWLWFGWVGGKHNRMYDAGSLPPWHNIPGSRSRTRKMPLLLQRHINLKVFHYKRNL